MFEDSIKISVSRDTVFEDSVEQVLMLKMSNHRKQVYFVWKMGRGASIIQSSQFCVQKFFSTSFIVPVIFFAVFLVHFACI